MSDIMFNDTGVDGNSEYKKDQWKKIAVHDDNNIKGFFGDYRFLSNFEPCKIWYEGREFSSTEHAYQAAKVVWDYRYHFNIAVSAATTKKLWKKFPLLYNAAEWDQVKYNIMLEIVTNKFIRNEDLAYKLLGTGNKYLEETNWWKDSWWGYDVNLKAGENNLGKILMKVRSLVTK